MNADDAAAARTRLRIVGDLAVVAEGPDVIVEAVPERLDLKRSVLREAEARRPALLGSNTSSIPITELAASLDRPEAFLGLHFFNPVWAMRWWSSSSAPATPPGTVERVRGLLATLGKDTIVVATLPASPPAGSVSPSAWRRSGCSRTGVASAPPTSTGP